MNVLHGIRRHRFHLFFALVIGALAFGSARAQRLGDDAAGTTYIIAYPDTVSNVLDSRYPNNRIKPGFSLLLYSDVGPNKVKIITAGGATTVVTLQADKFLSQDVRISPVVTVSNQIQYNSIRLEAEKPIVVYCYFVTTQSCEAWTPIPLEMWGKRYNIAGVPGDIVNDIGIAGQTAIPFTRRPAPAEALIISGFDNTHVTIHSGQSRLAGKADTTVTLGENQLYQIQSYVDTNAKATGQIDLAGISITSDKPIGVLSGNTRTAVRQDTEGIANNIYKNMLMEWLSPAEEQGTEFVYLPTWDEHRAGINSPSERSGESVRVYGTGANSTRGHYLAPGGGSNIQFAVPRDTMNEFFFGEGEAVYFKTDTPAQAMMQSTAIVKFNGSTGCRDSLFCLSYTGWAPYMVDLTPREQWTSFAPYYAPTNPANMLHYINVVCDTADQKHIYTEQGTPFFFSRSIPGTSLIWGTESVPPGQDHYLVGTNGARFAGYVYGELPGTEDYRPGNKGMPAEFEEYSALSYGYPLVSGHAVLRGPDTLRIDTVGCPCCPELTVTITELNADPVGLRSIALDPSTAINAKIIIPINLLASNPATVRVVPIDELKPASATMLIKDRTGKIWYVYYTYTPQRLDPLLTAIDFPGRHPGIAFDTTVVYHNLTSVPVPLADVRLALADKGFSIVSISRSLPTVMMPGDSISVTLRFNGTAANASFIDTLLMVKSCGSRGTILEAGTLSLGVEESRSGFALEAITPNPLTGRADIRFSLGAAGRGTLAIYDESGRIVAMLFDGRREAGPGSVPWDASSLPNGVYYCRLTSGTWSRTEPVVVQH